jgi:hypothetical protein
MAWSETLMAEHKERETRLEERLLAQRDRYEARESALREECRERELRIERMVNGLLEDSRRQERLVPERVEATQVNGENALESELLDEKDKYMATPL